MVQETDLFSREELSAGLPARRARARLYLIENRAALLAARDRRAVQPWRTEATEAEQDLAFLFAFAEGKAPPVRPTVQDLERYAASWAPLVPENAPLRAALAHAMGEKYRLVYAAVPGVRAALGLDTEPVVGAYLRRYGAPLSAIYTPGRSPLERVRWGFAALERWFAGLSPFWAAFALTFTEVLGAGALALPIALAGIGPVPGLAILLIFGLVNILTIAALTEAVTRHGGMRFGGAFLSQLFNDYLGPQSAAFAAAGLILTNALGLVAYFDGFGTTLAGMIPLPPLAWMAVLGLIVLLFLRARSMDATIGTTLLISAVNLSLILALLAITVPHVRPEHLLYANVPFMSGRPFDPGLLALVFGTVLLSFFGHTAVINGAGVILRRDPGGRSFVGGAIVAEVACTLVYGAWLLAINGSVPAAILAGTQSTVLTPLAAVVGPAVNVFGLIFMLLAVGVASIQTSLGIFNLMREWLPAPQAPTVVLPRRQGRLVLTPRRTPWRVRDTATLTLALTYLGPAGTGQGRFRIQGLPGSGPDGQVGPCEATIVAGEEWDAAAAGSPLAALGPQAPALRLQVQQATPHWVRLRVLSPLALRYEGVVDAAGLQMVELLDLPAEPAQVLSYLIRAREAGAAEIAAATGQDPAAVSAALAALAAQGQVEAIGEGVRARYRARFGRRRARQLPGGLAQAPAELGARPEGRVGGSLLQRAGPAARFWLAGSPILVIWLLAAVALLTGSESFTAPMAFSGTIVASLLSGIFPALLLAAGRRRGDLLPASAPRLLGHPLVLGAIYLLYLVGILLHGLVIWQDPVMRISALIAVGLTTVVTVNILQRGSLRPRLVVELRDETGTSGRGLFAVSNGGRAAAASVCLTYAANTASGASGAGGASGQGPRVENVQAAAGPVPDFARLCAASFAVPVAGARDLKVWVHRADAEGLSGPLPALVQVTCGPDCCTVCPEESGGQVVVPLADGNGTECLVRIELGDAADRSRRGPSPAVQPG